jgi:cardiolipin synthase A/B
MKRCKCLAFVGVLLLSFLPFTTAGASALSIVVEPAAGMSPIETALSNAKHSIELEMYEFDDSAIATILAQRVKAGVKVQVILDQDYSGYSYNASMYATLKSHGVSVIWAPEGTIYHAKFAVIDGTQLLVGTGNFSSEYYSSDRDFWIFDAQPADVQAAMRVFAADKGGNTSFVSSGTDLLWSPGATNSLVSLVESAKKSVQVENEEMDNTSIESALMAAASRGVAVSVIMTYSSDWTSAWSTLSKAGVKVYVIHGETPVYIHAKAICVDAGTSHQVTFVGSQNFSTSSLSYNRELGIITSNSTIVSTVAATLRSDAQSASLW